MLPEKSYSQWRAVAMDKPQGAGGAYAPVTEHGVAVSNRRVAERDLEAMLRDAKPPYDGGWIEHRTVTEWERET